MTDKIECKKCEDYRQVCIDAFVWMCDNGTYCSADIEEMLRDVLGEEWKDYK